MLIFGCIEKETEIDDRIILDSDVAALAGRIEYLDEIIPITNDRGVGKASVSADSVILTLIAEVSPPEIGGISLQATDVCISGNKAYVSYNVQGETFLGAVDVFNISDPAQPVLLANISFSDTDVNGVYNDGNYIYLAGAREADDLNSPAILERVTLQGGLPTDNTELLDLVSWAATDVTVANNNIYVTSGADDGAVSIIAKNTFTVSATYAIDDARGVDINSGDIGVIAGTPARLLVFDDLNTAPLHDYTLDGATIPFSKSTIEINRKKAIVAVGDGGVQVVCLNDGSVIDSLAAPAVAGLDPGLTVTNSASADHDILFIANGEAGVYVAESDQRFDSNDCNTSDLTLLGHLQFAVDQSVNHVAYKNNLLFIAGGLGGLKILTVDIVE